MPEIERPAKGWSVETLAAHTAALSAAERLRVDERFAAQEKALGVALATSDRAIATASAASEKRLDAMNEFRNSLRDQQLTFALRSETNIRLDATDKRIELIEASLARMAGKSSGVGQVGGIIAAAIAGAAAIGAVAITIVTLLRT